MPHQCTNCGHTFADGSKEMLSGCPECGGNKFQFHPDATPDEPEASAEPPEPPEPEGGSVTSAVGRAAASVRDTLSSSSGEEPDDWPGERDGADSDTDDGADTDDIEAAVEEADREDTAQADARSEMVTSDDLPPKPEREGRVVQEPESEERPDMDELRQELNSQFESIKVVAPGQYELNLMELYDREEYIIALQENGRYVIEVPESWREED
ncbi:Zn-ribbon containing protein [Salarchaeum sp. III]|uniref:OapC/ArvC family zinc-ribbon domain-containing protein n=1 Tax=Salarchaeum sp. III TaxID=3107927 RepID=UPI002ED908BB